MQFEVIVIEHHDVHFNKFYLKNNHGDEYYWPRTNNTNIFVSYSSVASLLALDKDWGYFFDTASNEVITVGNFLRINFETDYWRGHYDLSFNTLIISWVLPWTYSFVQRFAIKKVNGVPNIYSPHHKDQLWGWHMSVFFSNLAYVFFYLFAIIPYTISCCIWSCYKGTQTVLLN